MLYLVLIAIGDYRYDIKAGFFFTFMAQDIYLCNVYNISLLWYRDGLTRVQLKIRPPCFYLNKYYEVIIFGNDIYLPVSCGPVSFENAAALVPQVISGQLFSCFAQ